MKNKYILYFFGILAFFILVFLYMVEIPAPSLTIKENYNLEIK